MEKQEAFGHPSQPESEINQTETGTTWEFSSPSKAADFQYLGTERQMFPVSRMFKNFNIDAKLS